MSRIDFCAVQEGLRCDDTDVGLFRRDQVQRMTQDICQP